MAELLIKDLSEDILRRLEARAKEHGRTIEAEAAAVLEERVRLPERAAEPTITTAEWIEKLQTGPLSEVDDSIWEDILNRQDRTDSGRVVYISPEGIERLGELPRRE